MSEAEDKKKTEGHDDVGFEFRLWDGQSVPKTAEVKDYVHLVVAAFDNSAESDLLSEERQRRAYRHGVLDLLGQLVLQLACLNETFGAVVERGLK